MLFAPPFVTGGGHKRFIQFFEYGASIDADFRIVQIVKALAGGVHHGQRYARVNGGLADIVFLAFRLFVVHGIIASVFPGILALGAAFATLAAIRFLITARARAGGHAGVRCGGEMGKGTLLVGFLAGIFRQHTIEHFPIHPLTRCIVFAFHFHTCVPAQAGSPYLFLPLAAKYVGRFRPHCSICDEMRGDTKSVCFLGRLQTLF